MEMRYSDMIQTNKKKRESEGHEEREGISVTTVRGESGGAKTCLLLLPRTPLT